MKNIFLLIALFCSINTIYAQKELTNENVKSEIETLYTELNLLIKKTDANLYKCKKQHIVKKQIVLLKKIIQEKSTAFEDLEENNPIFSWGSDANNMYSSYLATANYTMAHYEEDAKLVNDLCKTMETSDVIKTDNDLKNIIELYNGYKEVADGFENYESAINEYYKNLLNYKQDGSFYHQGCENVESFLEVANQVDDVYPEIQKAVIDLNEEFNNLPKNQQQITISGTTEPLFDRYNGFIKSNPNDASVNPLSTKHIRKEIADLKSALNCNNEYPIAKTYYENGNLKTVGAKRNGLKTGVWKDYYENGNLYEDAIYMDGEKVGQSTIYFESGQPKSIQAYAPNYGIKESASYHENGQLKLNGNYENGQQTGEWIQYFENGQLEMRGNYENDEKTGEWIYYHENGQLKTKGNNENGQQTGEWKEY